MTKYLLVRAETARDEHPPGRIVLGLTLFGAAARLNPGCCG
jgi:hypothetical protein